MSEQRLREIEAYVDALIFAIGLVNPYSLDGSPLDLDGATALLRARFPEIPQDFRFDVTLH